MANFVDQIFPGMKKIFFLFSIAAIVSCNSDGSNSSADDTTSVNKTGVQNVNGNIPDTTNSINVGTDTDTAGHEGHDH